MLLSGSNVTVTNTIVVFVSSFDFREYRDNEYGDFYLVKLVAANGELVSVIARPTDNYSVVFLLEFHIKITPQFI